MLFTSAVIFSVATLTRNTIAAFISAIVLMVGYLIAQSLMGDMDNEVIGAMLNSPFGLNALDQSTKYWTVSEKNTMALPTNGVLLWNRILWICVSIGVFIFGYLRFSFYDRKQKAAATSWRTMPLFLRKPIYFRKWPAPTALRPCGNSSGIPSGWTSRASSPDQCSSSSCCSGWRN